MGACMLSVGTCACLSCAYATCVRLSLATRPCFLTVFFLYRADRLSREAGERARVAEIMGARAPPPSRPQNLVSDDYRFSTLCLSYRAMPTKAGISLLSRYDVQRLVRADWCYQVSRLLHSCMHFAQVWLQLRVCKLPWRPHS